MNLFETLVRLDVSGRKKLLGRAHLYLKDPVALMIVHGMDVNRRETFGPACARLRTYETLPGYRAKLAAWLRS